MAKGSKRLPRGDRRVHLVAWMLLSLGTAVLFASSYQGWGDPIIDLGRDLYLPSQLLEGRLLYRDLLYNYGPAAPYLLAGVVGVVGDSLAVFATVGMLLGLAVLAALYALGCRLGGVSLGFTSAALFLLLSFFANSTWGCNFVLPYSYAATLGIALSVWSFFFLHRYLADGRAPASLAVSVALMFGAALAKPEVGFGIAGVHVLAWCTHRVPRRAVLTTLAAGLLIALSLLALFAARDPSEHALLAENLARFVGDSESGAFFRVVAGIDRPAEHLLRSLLSLGRLALIIGTAAVAGAAPAILRRRRLAAVAVGIAAAVGCATLIWLWAEVRLFQATPILALAALGICGARDRRDPLLLLAAWTLLTAPRVLLQFHPLWYGFYLVVPAYLFLPYALGSRLAVWLPGRRGVIAALTALAVLVATRFEVSMWRSYQEKTSVLVTEKGTMRDYPRGRIEAIRQFLEYARTHLAPAAATIVVLPEGVSLNYLTGLRNPTAYYLFTPPEISTPQVEARIIRELAATAPAYLVFTSRDLAEFGRRGIGLDYALALGDWIRSAYELEQIFEADSSPPYRLLLLRRRPDS